MMKRWMGLLVAALLVGVGGAWAQSDATVTYGVPVEGEITDAQTDQTWTLTATSADRISVRVERLDGDLLPQIALRGADGGVLTTAGQDPTGAIAGIDRQDLPAAGSYQIVVQRQDGATGVTAGRYRLTVEALGVAPDSAANQSVVGAIEAGQTVQGEITPLHWYQQYTYTALAADVIAVDVQRLDGGLAPQIRITNANGDEIGYGYGNPDYASASVEYLELPAAGEYMIAVLRGGGFDGGSSGGYALSLELLGAGEGSPLLTDRATGTVGYGAAARGELGALWYEEWTFTAPSADVITIEARRDGANTLIPNVYLLDADGTELASAGPDAQGEVARIFRYGLEAFGEYTIRVERYGGKGSGMTGAYTLAVLLNGTGADNPALGALTGSVQMGATIEGEITDAQWQNRWQFDGREGQVVTIAVERASGTLYPIIELLAPNGDVITGGYYDASRSRAVIESATLPAAGTYVVTLRREGEQGGWTSGGYTLRVGEGS